MINMPLEFETKKVPMETLGEYLSEVRNQLNLTLEEVAQKTGVYEKFIYYIEAGKYQLLPPDVYVLGFLKKLAEVYAVSQDLLLEQYKKERGIVEHVSRERIAPQRGWKAWVQKVSITPKLLTVTGSVVVGVIAFFYVVIQVFAINKTPALTIFEPRNDTVIEGTSITVSGKTEPGITVSINGQNVFVKNDGSFQTVLGTAPGQSELRVEAQNKFGKKNTQLISMRVEEPQIAGAQTEVPSLLQLELKFDREATISVVRDGVEIPEEKVPAQAIKTISANEKIILTTSDAGGTHATLNGKSLGVLGKANQKITIPFTKDATELVAIPEKVTPKPAPAPTTNKNTNTVKPKPVLTTNTNTTNTNTTTNSNTTPVNSNTNQTNTTE